MSRAIIFIVLSVVLIANSGYARDDDPSAAELLMVEQLDALKDGDYKGFIANGNNAFKTFMDKYTFESFEMRKANKLAKGYQLEYLGAIHRLGMREHLWRVRITDYKYEFMGSLSISHGSVVGFNLD